MLWALIEKTRAPAYEKVHALIRFIFSKERRKTKCNAVFKKSLGMLIDGTPVHCYQFRALLMLCGQQMRRLQAWVAVY